MKDPILILHQLISKLWNDKKELIYSNPSPQKIKLIIKRLEKDLNEIETHFLKCRNEINMIKDLNNYQRP